MLDAERPRKDDHRDGGHQEKKIMKFKRLILYPAIGLGILCLLSVSLWITYHRIRDRLQIFDRDIIYNIFDGNGHEKLGFINADGSGQATIDVRGDYFSKPFWINNGDLLIGLTWMGLGVDAGNITKWSVDHSRHICYQYLVTDILGVSKKSRRIIATVIVASREIIDIDLGTCWKIRSLVTGNASQYLLQGGSLSPNRNLLLYTVYRYIDIPEPEFNIIQLDLTNRITTTLTSGVNPSWSPDGQKIAFVQPDGIYIMDKDCSDLRRVSEINYINSLPINVYEPLVSSPQWSPDGQLLIYHRCIDSSCKLPSAVFVYSLNEGVEKKVVDNGEYPAFKSP